MRCREPLPPGCPPDTAEEISTVWPVFRLVRTNPPADRDFRSQRWEKPSSRFHGVTECQARGLSVYSVRREAENASRFRKLRGRIICEVHLDVGAGRIQQTGRPSHHTWWPLATFPILAHCAMDAP